MKAPYAFVRSFLVLFALLSISFVANVYVHELGHFFTAQTFMLDPSIHVLNPLENGVTAFAAMEPVAFVQFRATTSPWQVFSVAIAGILWNILFGLLITYLYVHTKRTPDSTTFYLALILPCLLSVLLNLNVFSPLSDGSQIAHIVSEMLK